MRGGEVEIPEKGIFSFLDEKREKGNLCPTGKIAQKVSDGPLLVYKCTGGEPGGNEPAVLCIVL